METLVDLLTQSARLHRDRTATVMRLGVRSVRYTYAGLDERAHGYARLLHEHGVVKGDRVLLWAANQPDWVAAMFGSFLAGGVVVPLDVRSAREFVDRVVGQTEPVVAFAGRDEAPVLRELGVRVIEVESLRLPAGPPVEPAPLGPADLAEIIFTSGTTGDPKGVMLTHGNIASNVTAVLAVVPIDAGTRLISLLPLSHMFEQIGGCFAPLRIGAAIAYPASRQPAALARVMQEWKPTIIIAVPQVLTLFLHAIDREAAAQGKMHTLARLRVVARRLPFPLRRLLFRPVLKRFGGALDFVVSGGAALDIEVMRAWETMGIAVVEGYGTTECAPVITANPRHDRRPGSAGRVLAGQELRIAPDGEVQTRGPNVFPGYWRNETATQASFEDGWYCTGDLGEMKDGFLYLRGRKKDLIVLADGQNVYPEDVEDVLVRQPGVTGAVVLGIRRDGEVRVHAVVLEATPGAAHDAIRSANRLLDARQQILGVTAWPGEDFPRTHTLKVRRKLVLDYVENRASASPPAPPAAGEADPLLRLIAQARRAGHPIAESQSLGEDLGLDSLGRVELLSAIEEEIGVYVDDTAVDSLTSVAQLRALVDRGEKRPPARTYARWPRRRLTGLLRRALVRAAVFPALWTGYAIEYRGRANFRAVMGKPCIVICNHNMHLDQGMLLRTMPGRFRRRLAIAAAASDIFRNRVRGFLSALIGNAYPFAREGSGVRESLEHTGRLLEEGWNVLLFPEGKLTVCGPTQPFKSGIGLLAVETGVPVLPIRIDILRRGFYEGKWFPHPRARVRVSVGVPLVIPPGTGYIEATAQLEEAVRLA